MTGILKRTYDLESGPRHVPINKYVDSSNREYSDLLLGNPSEPEMQDFLEKRPILVPVGTTRGAALYPLHCGLIRQPKIARSEVLRARLHVDCFSQPGLVSNSHRD